MTNMIVFENWPYKLLEKRINWNKEVKRRERLLVLKAEYYGRGKTDDQKARSIGMTREQYWHLKKKHGLLEDENGYLREPREEVEEFWHDN